MRRVPLLQTQKLHRVVGVCTLNHPRPPNYKQFMQESHKDPCIRMF